MFIQEQSLNIMMHSVKCQSSYHLVNNEKPEKFLYPSVLLLTVPPHTTHLSKYPPHVCTYTYTFVLHRSPQVPSTEENCDMQMSDSTVTPTLK